MNLTCLKQNLFGAVIALHPVNSRRTVKFDTSKIYIILSHLMLLESRILSISVIDLSIGHMDYFIMPSTYVKFILLMKLSKSKRVPKLSEWYCRKKALLGIKINGKLDYICQKTFKSITASRYVLNIVTANYHMSYKKHK